MLHHMLRAAAARAFNILDPYFQYVTMLLHGDGSMLGSTTVTNFNADASTNNFNVTINGDARSDNFTPYQAGYYSNFFDGSGDYLTFPSNATFAFGTGDFTVEFWVNETSWSPTGGSNYAHWISINSYTTGVMIRPNLTGTAVEVWVGNTQYTFTTTLALGTWYHIAVSRSSSSMRFFVNGTQIGSTQTVSYNISTNTSNTIGTAVHSTTEVMQGYLSNLRIVSGSAVYTSNFTPSTTPLTAITNTSLLTCQSNRFIDNSTNAFTITKNGDTAVSPAQPFTLPSSVATYGSGYFDGTGDYLTAPSNSAFAFGTGDFTVECWAYFTSVANFPTLTDSRATTSSTAGFNLGLSTAKVQLYTTSQVLIGSTTLVANTWYHIAVTRSGTTLKIWLNGVQDATVSNSTNWSDTTLLIGSTPTPTNYMTGYITDTRLVKGTAVYSATFTPPTAPLTAITNTSLLTTQYNGGGNNSGFKDSSQFNFPITRNGNTTQGTFTPYGSNWSNYFDGTGDYLTVPDNAVLDMGSSDFTIEGFVFLSSTGASQTFVAKGTGAGNQASYHIVFNGTNWLYYLSGNGSTWSIASGVTMGAGTANTWQHLALVRSGSTFTPYVNGVAGTTTSSATALFDSTNVFSIGADDAANQRITGYISNCRVVKGTAVYTGTFTPSTTPLTAITNTQLLTCQSNRFIDNSTNAFTITKSGDASVQRFSPFSPTTAYSTSVIGGSGYFDGSGDYLTAANNAAFKFSGNFTVECFVYSLTATGGSNYNGIFDTRSGNVVSTTSANINFKPDGYLNIYVGGTNAASSTLLGANQWVHVAMVRSGSTVTLYQNGVSVATVTTSANLNDGYCTIGGFIADGYFNGYISNTRVVNGTAVYTSAFTPPTAPLTAITNTSLLLNYTNAGILDNAMMNDLETVGNAQISTSVKKYGTGSMAFDGTGDWLLFPADNRFAFGSGDYTVEAWVYFTSINSTTLQIIFMSGSTGGNNFYCHVDSDQISVGTTAAFVSNQTSSFSTNTWYHIAFCRSGGTLRLFKDGVQQGSSVTDSTNWISAGSGRVGANESGSQTVFGYIDDLRISKGVARYTANFTAPTAAFPNN